MVVGAYYFDKRCIEELVAALMLLPESIRPSHFSETEDLDSKENRADDVRLLVDFVRNHLNGFFLFADNGLYQILSAAPGLARCVIHFYTPPTDEIVIMLFKAVASFDPAFGFIADQMEYRHRNRLTHTIGKNKIETWVGRDTARYIPGLYWYTFLSDSLLNEHAVDIAALAGKTLSCVQLGDGYLLKYFESPENWEEHAKQLDQLCESTKGVFSSRRLDAAASRARNYSEYSDVVDQWS